MRPRSARVPQKRQRDFARLRSLSLEELKGIVRDALNTTDVRLMYTTDTIRQRLLPALLLVQQQSAHGEWEKFLKAVGLTPERVRQWRHRERVATHEIAELLGEPPARRYPKTRVIAESEAQVLAHAGVRLAKAVMGSNVKYAGS